MCENCAYVPTWDDAFSKWGCVAISAPPRLHSCEEERRKKSRSFSSSSPVLSFPFPALLTAPRQAGRRWCPHVGCPHSPRADRARNGCGPDQTGASGTTTAAPATTSRNKWLIFWMGWGTLAPSVTLECTTEKSLFRFAALVAMLCFPLHSRTKTKGRTTARLRRGCPMQSWARCRRCSMMQGSWPFVRRGAPTTAVVEGEEPTPTRLF